MKLFHFIVARLRGKVAGSVLSWLNVCGLLLLFHYHIIWCLFLSLFVTIPLYLVKKRLVLRSNDLLSFNLHAQRRKHDLVFREFLFFFNFEFHHQFLGWDFRIVWLEDLVDILNVSKGWRLLEQLYFLVMLHNLDHHLVSIEIRLKNLVWSCLMVNKQKIHVFVFGFEQFKQSCISLHGNFLNDYNWNSEIIRP